MGTPGPTAGSPGLSLSHLLATVQLTSEVPLQYLPP